MYRKIFFSLLLAGAASLGAQQFASTPPKSGTVAASTGTLPSDPAKLVNAVNASYYHPNDLSSLDCDVSIDWPAFLSARKMTPAADRLAAMQGLKMHSRALRGKPPEITFDWAAGPLDTKEQIEDGMRQMIGGYYQMYWSLFASSLMGGPAEIQKFEPLPDGTGKIYTSSQGTNVVFTINGEGMPTHYVLDSAEMKGTMDLQYTPSPHPAPGDLHRISGIYVDEQIGSSAMKVNVSVDYQAVDTFYVPRKATFELVGAYSIKLTFSGCSASRSVIAP
jgi:hypothetical protein